MDAYEAAGVSLSRGDAASAAAAAAARATHSCRAGRLGAPVDIPGGFAGALDFGDRLLVNCADTVGTKIDLVEKVANRLQQPELLMGLGEDLLAMVADDAVCLGAESAFLTNTFETRRIDAAAIEQMMMGLSASCSREEVVIAGGEVAEVGDKMSGTSWGASLVGFANRDELLTPASNPAQAGDAIIALPERGFRCNGFSLVRKVLADNPKLWEDEALLRQCIAPSRVYSAALLAALLGRSGEKRPVPVRALSHITGGGIPGNLRRVLPAGLGARLSHFPAFPAAMRRIKEVANVSDRECFEVWNGGVGMLAIVPAEHAEQALARLAQVGLEDAIHAGQVCDGSSIRLEHPDFPVEYPLD